MKLDYHIKVETHHEVISYH